LVLKEMQKDCGFRSDSNTAKGCPSDELLQVLIARVRAQRARDRSAPLSPHAGEVKPGDSLDL
jgi:hypothetical protein